MHGLIIGEVYGSIRLEGVAKDDVSRLYRCWGKCSCGATVHTWTHNLLRDSPRACRDCLRKRRQQRSLPRHVRREWAIVSAEGQAFGTALDFKVWFGTAKQRSHVLRWDESKPHSPENSYISLRTRKWEKAVRVIAEKTDVEFRECREACLKRTSSCVYSKASRLLAASYKARPTA